MNTIENWIQRLPFQNLSFFILGLRPNVEFFMRRTKVNELSQKKGRRLDQLSSSVSVWIVQHIRSVELQITLIMSEDRLRDKRRSSCATS